VTVVARNANEAVFEFGGICIWRESRDWSQAVGFVWCTLQEFGFSRSENIFVINLLHKAISYIMYSECDLER
jgi:hypothetical protein